MTREQLTVWVRAYERAWRTAGTDVLAELFTPDASYLSAPFEEPYRGLESIAAFWDTHREGADEAFEMDSEVVACEGDTGVVRLEVRYGEPRNRIYRDLWVVRLAEDGRCAEFEEWPFWPPGSGGSFAAGPSA